MIFSYILFFGLKWIPLCLLMFLRRRLYKLPISITKYATWVIRVRMILISFRKIKITWSLSGLFNFLTPFDPFYFVFHLVPFLSWPPGNLTLMTLHCLLDAKEYWVYSLWAVESSGERDLQKTLKFFQWSGIMVKVLWHHEKIGKNPNENRDLITSELS